MQYFLKKLKSIIRVGYLSKTADDSQKVQKPQVVYNQQVKNLPTLQTYGVSYNAPINTPALILQIENDPSDCIAIPLFLFERFKNLKSGEVQIGNLTTGDSVKFTEDGKIEVISSGEVKIKATKIIVEGPLEITGDVDIIGNLNTTGDVIATGDVKGQTVKTSAEIDLGSHTHYVSSAPGSTNPPN
jgi:phage gp45-like